MKNFEQDHSTKWLIEITPNTNFFSFNLIELWQYKDLLQLFVKRDFTTLYKQTILGPLWYIIQPLFTSIAFTIIFNNLAGIKTGIVPPFLFNLAGITVWNYFTACLLGTSNIFATNAAIFGKVYFPRLIIPLSIVLSNLIKFGIQFLIFIVFYLFLYLNGASFTLNPWVLLFPILILLMGVLGLGLGLLISSMVTKYRDFNYLLSFGVQLLMYVSAVMYPIALIQERIPNYAWIVKYNPLAYIIESSRVLLLNTGTISYLGLIFTVMITAFLLLLGVLVFNKTEKNFIDTV